MPTDKHKVSAYLSDDDLELLESVASHYRMSKSQALIQGVRHLADIELPDTLPSSSTRGSGISRSEVEKMIESQLSGVTCNLPLESVNETPSSGVTDSLLESLNGQLKAMVADSVAAQIDQKLGGVTSSLLESPEWGQKIESVVSEAVATASAAKLEPLQNDVSSFRQQLEDLAEKIPPSPENGQSRRPLEDTKMGSNDETTQSHDETVTEPISEDSATEAPPSNLDEPQQQELKLTEGSTTTEPQPTAISTPELTPETEESQTDEQSQAEEKLEAVEAESEGLTQARLAERLGVRQSSVSRWASGKSSPRDPAIAEKFSQWQFNEETKLWYRISAA